MAAQEDFEAGILRTGAFTCAPILIIGFNRPEMVRGLLRMGKKGLYKLRCICLIVGCGIW